MDHHAGQGQIVFSANALPVVAPSWTDILFLSSRHSESIWKSELLAPAYLSLLSIALLLLRSLVASEWFKKLWAHIRHHNKEGDIDAEADIDESVIRTHAGILADVKSHVKAGGGCIVFGWKLLRLAGCLALVGLTIATLVIDEGNRESSVIDIWKHKKGKGKKKKKDVPVSDEFTNEEWVHVALCLTYLYTSFLALISIAVKKRWTRLANTHLVFILSVAWIVLAYRDLWPFATYNLHPADITDPFMWPKVIVLSITAVVVPLLIPRPYVPIDPSDPAPQPNPEQTTPFLSLIFFSFLDSVIWKAYRIPHLPADQLPPLADYDRGKVLRKRGFKHLDVFSGAKKQHLFFSFMTIFKWEYVQIFLMTVLRVVTLFAGPVGIRMLLRYLEEGPESSNVRPWVWVSWLFLGPMIGSISLQWYIFLTTGTLVRTEAIVTQLIFEHSLRIRVKAETSSDSNTSESTTAAGTPETASLADSAADTERSETATATGSNNTQPHDQGDGKNKKGKKAQVESESKSSTSNLAGKLNNLVTTDLQNITNGRDFMLVVVHTPVLLGLGIWFLYDVLGWSAFVGLAVMIVLFPVPGYVAKIIQKVQKERMKKTDARIESVTEIMNVVRMVKMFGWEPKMEDRLSQKRNDELKLIWLRQMLDILNGTLNFIIPVATMVVTYFTYVVIMKQQLSASIVYSSMAVFDLLRDQVHMIFFLFPMTIQAKVSLDRVTEFLNDTELLDEFDSKTEKHDQIDLFTNGPSEPDAIGFSDASFVWTSVDGSLTPSRRKFRLTIEDKLEFKRGALNLIIGPTGSGKTSLLMALLGEMHFLPSQPTSWYNLPRDKGVAFAAQESWVQNETIRNNILFGTPYDEERYKKVIQQCGLERDLALFDAGDETEVGEKGLTLSGGQKARVTLARAVYSSADILLLDDVLAALDVHTSRWIVDKCFQGDLLKARTVILVTHNVAMVSPIASFMVSLGSDGHIASQGSVAETLLKDDEAEKELEESQDAIKKAAQAEEIEGNLDEAKPKSDGKLVVAEEIAEGHVSWAALKLYLFNLGGPVFWFCFLMSMLIVDFGSVAQTWYLGYWASQYEIHDPSEVSIAYHLGVFISIISLGVIVYFLGYLLYIGGTIRASRNIHKKLIESILGTTLRWLDSTPSGRIITRCTQDISEVDGPVSQNLGYVIELTLSLAIRFAAIVFMSPIFVVPGFIVGLLGSWCGQIYIKAQLSVKREMSNAKAPVMSHFGAAMAGLVSIRAFSAQHLFKDESLARIDRYVRSARTFYNLNRWVCVRIDALGGLFSAGLAAYLVYGRRLGSASNTGFSLNMAVAFSSMILWWIRILNQFEVSGNSLERLQGYIDIEQEPKPTDAGVPPAYWPSSGTVDVKTLSARYSLTGPKVLQDISFSVKSGERVGVVGRTGSGKSSLTLSLLRCIFTEGTVLYDGLATSGLNLDALRRNITIIPQQPELLSGSLRYNLDPFDEHDDATLNDALRSSGLHSLQKDDEARITLDSQIAAGGANLSVGQRQILALARAIVRKSKLLILDEATSAIDYSTDNIIQQSLRNELGGDVTLITVAHRLQTIMDSDKIMVLDAGKLVEFDSPGNLLKKEGGMLKSLVDGSGDRDDLYKMAAAAKQ